MLYFDERLKLRKRAKYDDDSMFWNREKFAPNIFSRKNKYSLSQNLLFARLCKKSGEVPIERLEIKLFQIFGGRVSILHRLK